jgi:glycosyltransferase A (GT-A) superfamily protein (DUF2064 family)
MTAAAWWFRHQVRRLLRTIQDPRWDVVLAVAPDHAGLSSRVWPTGLHRIPQGNGTLGDRMARVLGAVETGPVCLIGGDIPHIKPKHIARAFAQLGPNDAIFGPSPDGGFWLVGLKRTRPMPPQFFQSVRWSTEHALADTIATLPTHRIAFCDTLNDVDTVADLNMTFPTGRDT